MTAPPCLIAVDWGTSSCRAALLAADGAIVDRLQDGPGILAVTAGAFDAALQVFLTPWLSRARGLPVVLSGMIGSRQGWREVPYLSCPAGMDEIASALTWIDSTNFGRIALVAGLETQTGGAPDVMRGEEVQIVGALGKATGRCVLPGTHSKWATVEAGRITRFQSYMTGEVFAALRDHTILGRLMEPSSTFDVGAFEKGVRDACRGGGPGALLNRIFATRTRGLFGQLPATSLADYLSGMLIGAEIEENMVIPGGPVTVVGSTALTERYVAAARLLGQSTTAAPPDSAARGAFMIARSAGLFSGTSP